MRLITLPDIVRAIGGGAMVIKGRRRNYTEEEWRKIVQQELQQLHGRSPAAAIENLLEVHEVAEESRAEARRSATGEQMKVTRQAITKVTVALNEIFRSWPPAVTTAVGRAGDFATAVEGVVTAVKKGRGVVTIELSGRSGPASVHPRPKDVYDLDSVVEALATVLPGKVLNQVPGTEKVKVRQGN
jgi:hypothetical protein